MNWDNNRHKKVSEAEVARLFEFTRQHYVEYYDLQAELADHLANGIEEQWKLHPELNFEEALQKEFKKFGIFGFTTIVEERTKALGKRYHKIMFSYLVRFFKLPRVLGTIGTMYILYVALTKMPYALEASWILLITTIVAVMVYMAKNKRKYKLKEKKFLFREIIFSYGLGVPVLLIPLNLLNLSNMMSRDAGYITPAQAIFLSIIIILYYLYVYIVVKVIPQNAEKYLLEVYPEYKLMKKM